MKRKFVYVIILLVYLLGSAILTFDLDQPPVIHFLAVLPFMIGMMFLNPEGESGTRQGAFEGIIELWESIPILHRLGLIIGFIGLIGFMFWLRARAEEYL